MTELEPTDVLIDDDDRRVARRMVTKQYPEVAKLADLIIGDTLEEMQANAAVLAERLQGASEPAPHAQEARTPAPPKEKTSAELREELMAQDPAHRDWPTYLGAKLRDAYKGL